MAQEHFLRYQYCEIDKNQILGRGAYGFVCKAKCDQLPCVAKVIHSTILDPRDPGSEKIVQQFVQECAFLAGIRHPHIVQYLGVATDPDSGLQVLLMERLDESLTKMLERSQKPIAYFIQVDICRDIALAIAFLHSNGIIHRDLSSNNVLMIAGRRAKVTDFGMSKLASAAPTRTPLTTCPGTQAYMPPEALDEPPRYTKKLDCFSEGVLMIQVCTRLWPEPGPSTQAIPFPASPTGITKIPVLDFERRKAHIDKIDPNHPLRPIALDCIQYDEIKRPSSEELCQRLTTLKESTDYSESVQKVENTVAELEREINDTKAREAASALQLRDTIQQLSLQEQQFEVKIESQAKQFQQDKESLEKCIQGEKSRNQKYQQELKIQNEQHTSLKQRLMEQEQITAMIQQANQSLQMQVDQLRKKLSYEKQQKEIWKLSNAKYMNRCLLSKSLPLLGKFMDGGNAPLEMLRGDVAVIDDVAYFMSVNGELCSYDSITKKWQMLPTCPYVHSSLVVVRGLLTSVGGGESASPVNKLLSLIYDDKEEWVENFPSMLTKRCYCTAITTGEHLIVAGGESNTYDVTTVEVMDIQTLIWTIATASLPQAYSRASATICGGHLYMVGGWVECNLTKTVLTCSVAKLLQSCIEVLSDSVWARITDLPMYGSSCAAVNGELVAVGGLDAGNKTTTAVYKYNATTTSWEVICNLTIAHHHSLVAVLPNSEMIVVGGSTSSLYYPIGDIQTANIAFVCD